MKLSDNGIASALSIDSWSPPPFSGCKCEKAPHLSVNFLSMYPGRPNDEEENANGASASKAQPPNKPTAARFQEIFVDYIGMHCASLDASSRHVLDDRFDSFLGKGEREFKDAVMKLMKDGMTHDARNTVAYRTLDEMLRSKMGFSTSHFWSKRGGLGKYPRQESTSSRSSSRSGNNSNVLSGGILSKLWEPWELPREANGSGLDSRTEILQSILDDIRSDKEMCQRLRFRLLGNDSTTLRTSASEEDKLRSILQEIVPTERLDILFESMKDPSFQHEARAFRSLWKPPGHVFVCNASVCDLHCDAFLCPGDISRESMVLIAVQIARPK
mmetsp:Transcript_41019/g.86198  ORF Transcript_41019/g.86198 Transcript_41019/m.86198 type:complete len:329 (-) Transcript_41019:328-1314(-)